MNKEEITISGLIRLIESEKKVRLNGWQLAQFFGIYESAINTNVGYYPIQCNKIML
jgi:hypothetical protein